MKRIGNKLWNKICSKDNIRKAIEDAIRKEKDIDMTGWEDEIYNMLSNETYKFHPLRHIIKHEPKERVIDYAQTYPDKVLINCVMNQLKPYLIPKFTETTFSSIKGRGIHQCVKRIKKAVKRYPDAYYLQTDIKKYYQSIDKNLCIRELERYVKDKKCLKFFEKLLDNHKSGLPIGISAGSYLANLFLTNIDRWIYQELKPLVYVRYMDDQLFIFKTKDLAKKALLSLKEKLHEYKLELKNNSRISPVNKGISMVGYIFYPSHTKLRKNIKENMKKKSKLIKNLDEKAWKQQMASYYGWCKHADCKHLTQVVFGNKNHLFNKMGEYKKLSEIKESINFFGLPKDKRISILNLVGVEIVILDYLEVSIKGEKKIAVKFCYADNDDENYLFITRSETIKDKLEKDQQYFPCIITIIEKTTTNGRRYFSYN